MGTELVARDDGNGDLFNQIEPIAVVEIIKRPDGSIDLDQTVSDDEALAMIAWAQSIITVWRAMPPIVEAWNDLDFEEEEEEDDE